MNAEELAAIRKLLTARALPWSYNYENIEYRMWVNAADGTELLAGLMKIPEQEPPYEAAIRDGFAWRNDIELIVEMVNAVPALVAHSDALTAKVEGLRPNAMQYTKERAGFEDALAAVLAILRGEA